MSEQIAFIECVGTTIIHTLSSAMRDNVTN